MDEVYYAEHPQNTGCDGLWPGMMGAIMNYMIPGEDTAPCLDDNVNLFPMVGSTWTSFRADYRISPAEKVFAALPGLSEDSVTQICSIVAEQHPEINQALQSERFKNFLVSCALVPDGLRIGLETAIERMRDATDEGLALSDQGLALIAKHACVKFGDLYKPGVIPLVVLEFSMSGIPIPDVEKELGGHPFTHWLEVGFATGAVNEPLGVSFPIISNLAGTIVPVLDTFVNWGQPFYWQHFEAIVPHIIRLRCASLYRVKPNHQATLREIFGGGCSDDTVVKLISGMRVVTCSKQWLPAKGKQLKVKSLNDHIDTGEGRLCFGSRGHVFSACDGNVHFDGHTNFVTDDDREVAAFYQTKHTKIKGQSVAYFRWDDEIFPWLTKARSLISKFKCDVKLFVIVTNKEVRGIPAGGLPSDLVLIHQGNLATFFAPCFLASARLARDE